METKPRCCFCGKYLTTSEVMYYEGRQAHRECYKESSEKEKLFVFIKSLYSIAEVGDKIKSQVDNFMSSINNLTYADIRDSLYYFHIVSGNPITSRDTIGIVPKIYEEARSYFFYLRLKRNTFKKGYKKFLEKETEQVIIKRSERERKLYNLDEIVGGD